MIYIKHQIISYSIDYYRQFSMNYKTQLFQPENVIQSQLTQQPECIYTNEFFFNNLISQLPNSLNLRKDFFI
jgi:hypothetical protein